VPDFLPEQHEEGLKLGPNQLEGVSRIDWSPVLADFAQKCIHLGSDTPKF
jgi:hypothetical protein